MSVLRRFVNTLNDIERAQLLRILAQQISPPRKRADKPVMAEEVDLTSPRMYDGLTEKEVTILLEKWSKDYPLAGKIEVIKEYRRRSDMGLKESKDFVDAWLNRHPDFVGEFTYLIAG